MNNTPTPAVDIALATYNGEPYLPQLLKSIEKQEYGHWHLIAGDDGSTDQTTRILEEFANKHPNKTTILPAGKQQGTTANFSRTLQACRSCYVMPADQDDIWLSNKISTSLRCVRALEHQLPSDTPVLIHTDASVTDHQGRLIARSFWHHQNLSPKFGLKFKNLLVQNVITGCTMLTNRPLLDLALPIPPESILHDWWLGLTAAAFGQIDYIREPTLQYRQHAENQVGAKKWSPQTVAHEAASGIPALQKRIAATLKQATAFKTRFNGQLKANEQAVLDVYTEMLRHRPAARKICAARQRLHKCGFLRTIGFYAAL